MRQTQSDNIRDTKKKARMSVSGIVAAVVAVMVTLPMIKCFVDLEMPRASLETKAASAKAIIGLLPIFLVVISAFWSVSFEKKRTKGTVGTPQPETIRKDASLKILGRKRLLFWALLCLGYLLLFWRYTDVFSELLLWFAAGCGGIWLWCAYRSMRDLAAVRTERFDLRRDILVGREHITGSEDEDIYALYYRCGDNVWKKSVNEEAFHAAKEGAAVLSVYLPGRKKPLIYYDETGKAC